MVGIPQSKCLLFNSLGPKLIFHIISALITSCGQLTSVDLNFVDLNGQDVDLNGQDGWRLTRVLLLTALEIYFFVAFSMC